MQKSDLELVLSWRNHPEIRRYMYTRHEITLDEHNQWFSRHSNDPDRHMLVFELDSTPLGFINIHQIAPGGIAEWGFYTAPDAPAGTGRLLGQASLCYAFDESGLHKLTGQVLACNERSVRYHQALGFTQEGILREQYFDGQLYQDVVCFGLLANEWQSIQ